MKNDENMRSRKSGMDRGTTGHEADFHDFCFQHQTECQILRSQLINSALLKKFLKKKKEIIITRTAFLVSGFRLT